MKCLSETDSEFNSETEEQECRLYTQLYFGNKDDSCKKDGIEINLWKRLKNMESPLYNLNEKSIDVNYCKSQENISTLNKNYGNDKYNTISSISTKSTKDLPSLVSPSINSRLESESRNSERSPKSSGKRKRQRNDSVHSIDSISGREPLDSLYCDFDDYCRANEPLSTVSEEESMNPLNDYEQGSIYNISTTSKKTNTKSKLVSTEQLYSDTASEDEICILPPPKIVETVTVDLSSSDDDSIQIVDDREDRKSSTKTSSMSSDSEYEFLEASKSMMGPLAVNVRKHAGSTCTVFSRKSPIKKRSNFTNSKVIFPKERKLSKRVSSCPKWTAEMNTFYDSDVSEDFDVADVHASQSDDPAKWKVVSDDCLNRYRKRYFKYEARCYRCKDTTHQTKNCPRIPHCLYCGSTEHSYSICPYSCCLKCGGTKWHSYCHSFHSTCKECGQNGHPATHCPDIWRRFHLTTTGNIPVKPAKSSKMNEKKVAYCYNCGERGHYGHLCPAKNYSQYCFVSTVPFSYEVPSAAVNEIPSKRPVPLDQSYNAMDGLLEEKGNLEYKDELVTKYMSIPKSQGIKIVKSREIRREIIDRCNIQPLTWYLKGGSYKVRLMGTQRQVMNAGRLIRVVSRKLSSERHRDFQDFLSEFAPWLKPTPPHPGVGIPTRENGAMPYQTDVSVDRVNPWEARLQGGRAIGHGTKRYPRNQNDNHCIASYSKTPSSVRVKRKTAKKKKKNLKVKTIKINQPNNNRPSNDNNLCKNPKIQPFNPTEPHNPIRYPLYYRSNYTAKNFSLKKAVQKLCKRN